MAFHIDTYDLPRLLGYSDALNYWSRIKPWRGDPDRNSRPIAGRKKRHLTIRKLNDGSIAMRLWSTDVVIYHPNGDISLEAYQSTSTDSFARCLTPPSLGTSWNSDIGYMLHLGRGGVTCTFLQRDRHITLRRNDKHEWEPVDPDMLRPFNKYVVNVKKANAALKEAQFRDFCTWLKAVTGLGRKFLVDPWSRDIPTPAKAVELLKEGGESWIKLAEASSGDTDLVRRWLYIHYQCVEHIEVPYVVGYDTASIRASNNRWRNLAKCY